MFFCLAELYIRTPRHGVPAVYLVAGAMVVPGPHHLLHRRLLHHRWAAAPRGLALPSAGVAAEKRIMFDNGILTRSLYQSYIFTDKELRYFHEIDFYENTVVLGRRSGASLAWNTKG